MIDRGTARVCAVLIIVMLMAALWRIALLDDWTTLPNHGALSLSLLLIPACAALVVGALYWDGLRADADEAKLRPWRDWGRLFTIGYCGILLLVQSIAIVGTLGLDLPVDLAAIERAAAVVLSMVGLLAVNRMPKLPWFERRFAPGGELGPIYGPRFTRVQSRILAAFIIAVTGYSVAAPPSLGWRSAIPILLATALLVIQSIVWRRRLGHKWRVQQAEPSGQQP